MCIFAVQVLEEYRDSAGMSDLLEPSYTSYFSADDRIFLEDESDRILLTNWADMARVLVTGVTLAVKGQVMEGGEFQVRGGHQSDVIATSSSCSCSCSIYCTLHVALYISHW